MQTEWKAHTGYVSLARRSVNTLLLARKISKSISKLEKDLALIPGMDEEDRAAKWTELHRKNARLAHRHILKYRGFLTKVGQAASIKAGELPRPWVEELQSLQDELPVSSYKEVRATIKRDLGRPLEHIFSDFAERPVASASVAQAHVAHLRTNGRKVCVKVQHKGVASMVGTDLATIEFIADRAAKHHPDAPDTTDLIREWRRASREEVDFKREGQNAVDASNGLKRLGIDVGCPEPIEGCCGKLVLTMAFIEGWKITDVDKLPAGTDREAICLPLVDAFAALAFEVGLIHGDPHPGNVFAESLGGDGKEPRRFRAALLDWGIVQRMDPAARAGAARWVVSVLAQDRVLYLRSLQELGFVFDQNAHPDSAGFSQFIEASMGSCGWMFRDSIPSSAQLHFMEQMARQSEKQENLDRAQGKMEEMGGGGKILSKVPGLVLFFLRGLEMLQNICGTLEVVVPFSKVVLKRAMPILMASDSKPTRAMPAPAGCSELEAAVRATMQELDDAGAILGAQIAVLSTAAPDSWLCRVTAGRQSLSDGPLASSSLLPLLDAGVGVLLCCLLTAISRPTVAGKTIDFESPVTNVWPDFAQRDKGNITFGELLQHRAGLVRQFPRDMTFRAFCNELRVEHVLASAPREPDSEGEPCRVIGALVSALLRRVTGHKKASDALYSALQPLGLQNDIVFYAAERRMAFAGRKPRESMSMERMYEFMEEKMEALSRQEKDELPQWITWSELGFEKPAITDPLLVNRECTRKGEGIVPGRCLRATAEAVCQLLASDQIPHDLFELSREPAQRLRAECQDDWHDLGGCLDIATGGWQLVKFRSLSDNSEVIAHGSVDGATGSLILRLPEYSVAVLLSSVDKDSRHVGHAILDTIAGHLGLKLMWSRDGLNDLPKKRGGQVQTGSKSSGTASASNTLKRDSLKDGKGNNAQADESEDPQVAELQAKVARLMQTLEQQQNPGGGDGCAGVDEGDTRPLLGGEPGDCGEDDEEEEEEENEEEEEQQKALGLAGAWNSVETKGLDALLEVFDVPAMARSLAAMAKRSLNVEVKGDDVTIATKTCMMGRTVEDTTTNLVVGNPFTGEQDLGGHYDGRANWIDDVDAEDCERTLVLMKTFALEGRNMVLEERFELEADCEGRRLALTTTLKAPSDQQVRIADSGDRDLLCSSCDPSKMSLKRELDFGGAQLLRGGIIIGCGPASSSSAPPRPGSMQDVQKMKVPGVVLVRYEDLSSTTTFEREEVEAPSRGKKGATSGKRKAGFAAAASGFAEAGLAAASGYAESLALRAAGAVVSQGALPKPKKGGNTPDDAAMPGSCAIGLLAVSWAVGSVLGNSFQALGRSAKAACETGVPSKALKGGKALQKRLADADSDFARPLAEAPKPRKRAEDEADEDEVPRSSRKKKPPPLPVEKSEGISEEEVEMEFDATLSASRSPLREGGSDASDASHHVAALDANARDGPNSKAIALAAAAAAAATAAATAAARVLPPVPPLPGPPSDCGASEVASSRAASSKAGGNGIVVPAKAGGGPGMSIQDPRPARSGSPLSVILFCGFDPDRVWETKLGHGFLGPCYDLGTNGLRLEAPCSAGKVQNFKNAEAAFHALKFWALGPRFARLSGEAAREKQEKLGGHADSTFGGFGSAWQAMLAVSRAKFVAGSEVATSLLATGDALLLSYDPAVVHRGPSRSDCLGGANLLGMLLLLVRDELSGGSAWTRYIGSLVNLPDGKSRGFRQDEEWRQVIVGASSIISETSGSRDEL